ncbi:MAG: hypothetical protein AB7H77_11255 [Bdellovibrionales bacterium]
MAISLALDFSTENAYGSGTQPVILHPTTSTAERDVRVCFVAEGKNLSQSLVYFGIDADSDPFHVPKQAVFDALAQPSVQHQILTKIGKADAIAFLNAAEATLNDNRPVTDRVSLPRILPLSKDISVRPHTPYTGGRVAANVISFAPRS